MSANSQPSASEKIHIPEIYREFEAYGKSQIELFDLVASFITNYYYTKLFNLIKNDGKEYTIPNYIDIIQNFTNGIMSTRVKHIEVFYKNMFTYFENQHRASSQNDMNRQLLKYLVSPKSISELNRHDQTDLVNVWIKTSISELTKIIARDLSGAIVTEKLSQPRINPNTSKVVNSLKNTIMRVLISEANKIMSRIKHKSSDRDYTDVDDIAKEQKFEMIITKMATRIVELQDELKESQAELEKYKAIIKSRENDPDTQILTQSTAQVPEQAQAADLQTMLDDSLNWNEVKI